MNQNELCEYFEGQLYNSRILVIGGYPCCGKTTISNILQQRIANVQVIEAEHWLYSLEDRVAKNISGSNPLSYDMGKSIFDINNLLSGAELCLPIYSHAIGKHCGTKKISTNSETKIILDGTLFTAPEFFSFTPNSFLLKPEDYEKWLENSILRDIEQRSYNRAQALEHNERKYVDMGFVEKYSIFSKYILCCHDNYFMYNLIAKP